MEKIIKYKRFVETHTEKTLQEFYDKLVSEGWEIIYYDEIRQSSGTLTNSPQEINIHVTVVGCKKQNNIL